MSIRIELNNTEQSLSLSHDELLQIFEDMGVVVDDPNQKFQIQFDQRSGGKIMTDLFGSGDFLVISHKLENVTVTDLDQDPETPPDVPPPTVPTQSCVNCLPDSLYISVDGGSCGLTLGTLTMYLEDTPVGTYNKIWRSDALTSNGVTPCPDAWYIELRCLSYNENTNRATFELRSTDSSFKPIKQLMTQTVTFPCNATGSVIFSFAGTIYPGYLTSATIVNDTLKNFLLSFVSPVGADVTAIKTLTDQLQPNATVIAKVNSAVTKYNNLVSYIQTVTTLDKNNILSQIDGILTDLDAALTALG